MRRVLNNAWGRLGHWSKIVAPVAVVNLGLTGCGHFWEDVSRRDLTVQQKFTALWETPDPLVVLRDSQDGDMRARALRALQEPKQHGRSDKNQDAIVNVLLTTAKSDTQPLCRLAAIQTLARFKDPRCVHGLIDSYYKATVFAPETATVIQCEALKALGATKDPAGLELLTRVVRAPKPALDVPESEKQQERDRRLAAARSLGNFREQQASEALVHVLKTEKDVALRDGAHEALVTATGKKLPNDPRAWEHEFDPAGHPAPPEEKKFSLTGWFQN